MDKFEVIILGAGPGGYLLAERIGKKLKTAIIEKDAFGGTCLNVGCIPSKAILYSRKIYDYILHSEQYGIKVDKHHYDHEQVIKRKDQKVALLVKGVEAKVKANNVSIFRGQGQILKHDQDGFHLKVNDKTIVSEKLVIATGSVPLIPPIEGLAKLIQETDKVMTNTEILSLTKLPQKLVIIGGGVIGLEMAAYFNALVPELNVVEFLPHVGGVLDLQISDQILKYYQKRDVKFHLNNKVVAIDKTHVIVEDQASKTKTKIAYDKILLATGRKPNIETLGVDKINLYLEKNAIVTNLKGQTNIANCYAIGDVNGKSMLAHTAYREAEVVANQLLGKTWDQIDYNAIPNVIYTYPEIATIGYTEEALKDAKIDYKVFKMPLIYSGRFVTEVDDYEGLAKMLIHAKTRQILGVHIIGQYATEIISIAGLMVAKGMTIDLVSDLVVPHPTVAEILKELIMEGLKHA